MSQKFLSSKKSKGPTFQFCWSSSMANLTLIEDNSPEPLPSIDPARSRRKTVAVPSSFKDESFISGFSISTSKSVSLPLISIRYQSPPTTEKEEEVKSPRTNPLLLSSDDLHYIPSPSSITKKSKRSRLFICSTSNERRKSTASLPTPTIESTVSKTLLSNQTDDKYAKYNYQQLSVDKLRRLSVSEQYIKEAKKLYFNLNSKVFVPRSSLPKIILK